MVLHTYVAVQSKNVTQHLMEQRGGFIRLSGASQQWLCDRYDIWYDLQS